MKIFTHIPAVARALFAGAAVLSAASCSNSFIFDYEGDCDPKYRVKFRYDHNLKFADAFAHEVDHITLNVIDSEGRIVHTHIESGDALAQDGFEVVLDDVLEPGNYRLQAWCGAGAKPGSTSFTVHEAEKLEDLKCTLLPDDASRADVAGADGTHVERGIEHLYHGLTEELEFPDDEGVHSFTVPLMKNTNTVKVVLQQLSGLPVDGNLFDFTITSANARMDHDNSLIASDPVVYHAWDIQNGYASIDHDSGSAIATGSYNATVAEFTIARLMEDEDVRLEARRRDNGQLVFSVNMVELALMVKGSANRPLPDQEYLDRQDDYNFVFFLDAQYRWIDSFIFINSWKVVFQNTEV